MGRLTICGRPEDNRGGRPRARAVKWGVIMRRLAVIVALAALLGMLEGVSTAVPAGATVSGTNGQIAFARQLPGGGANIFIANPDGTQVQQVPLVYPAEDFGIPRWDAAAPPSRQASSGLHILAVVGDVYQALADPTRRKILDELADRDDQTLFEICARLAMKHRLTSSRQAISQHLDVLEAAGLIITRREGRYKFHHLNRRPLEHIADRWLTSGPHRRPDENHPD